MTIKNNYIHHRPSERLLNHYERSLDEADPLYKWDALLVYMQCAGIPLVFRKQLLIRLRVNRPVSR